jgi:alpha-glutamyl/putrescinyl thymine pyrophosphorylase clade 1
MALAYLDRIRNLSAIQRFEYYITERYTIRERRRMDEPREAWTQDPIFQTFKFTNVRRAWDFTSEWLTREWYTPHGNHANAGIAAVVARFFCLVPSLDCIGFPYVDFVNWKPSAQRALEDRAARGIKVFTSAYMIAGGGSQGRSKVEWVFNDIITPAYESGLLAAPWYAPIDDLHERLRALNGFGDFMTQEVVLDLMQTKILRHRSLAERKWYGWAGPGAKRGLNRLADRDTRHHFHRDVAKQEMVDTHDVLIRRGRLPVALSTVLTLHDVEFSLCEFDKYERVLWGHGTPKQKFVPRSDVQPSLELS